MIDPMFDGVVGHEKILKILAHHVKSHSERNHVTSAFLFVGPDGVGKRLVAERFARLLLKHPLSAPLEAHPDFVRVTRQEGAKEIVVKQARELMQAMHLTSAMGGKKVALIEQADRLNEEAANALLKDVEEPSPNTVYLFVAEQPDRLPATMRSRLTLVPFERVPAAEMERGNQNEKKMQKLIEASRGCPGVLARLLEDQGAFDEQLRQSERLLQTLESSPAGVQCAALEELARSLEAQNDAESAWRERLLSLMRSCNTLLKTQPDVATRLGHGLIHAWHLAGSSLSPRLALEWMAVSPYLIEKRSVPSFLTRSYL